jgi:D-alanyl-D-alanine carboxypeptidase
LTSGLSFVVVPAQARFDCSVVSRLDCPEVSAICQEVKMPSFYEDVIKNDGRFKSVNRVADPNLLEPVTRSAIANILHDARALGIELMIFETYRSQARQQELFNQGGLKAARGRSPSLWLGL